MASKYTTRGVADMKQHDEAIKKSAAEIYKYERQVKQADAVGQKWLDGVKGNIGTVTKFLGTIGLATGTLDVFTKSIRHNQTTSDALDQAQAALNTTVNNFYHSLSSGDFSYFTNGLSSIISRAKEAQIAVDQLGNTMMSYSLINARTQNKIATARAIYYDPASTKEQKEQAKKDMKAATKELEDATNVAIADVGNTIRTAVSRDTNIDSGFITDAMINKALEVNATKGREGYKDKIESEYSTYQKELIKVQKKYTKYRPDALGNSNPYITDTASFNKEMDKLNKTYSESIVGHALLVKYTDEELQNLTNQAAAAYNLDTQLQSLSATENRLNNRAFKTGSKGGSSGGGKSKSTPTPTSTLNVPTLSFGGLEEEISYLKKRNEYIAKGTALWEEYKAKSTSMMGDTDANNRALEKSLELHQETLNNIEEERESEKRRQEAMWDSIGAMGSAFSSLSKELEMPAFDIMGTIGQAIANIALSYSQATAQAASMGPWAWLAFAATGLAEMVSVISAIKSNTQGYASGGIIGGSTTIGDYDLARVNKGEMILNGREQSRLFDLLSGSGSIAPGVEDSTVKFRISGPDLVGVLKNYDRKRGKVL